ncbi:23S rRNA pseudouridine(1911/1915/1917) synthase RluD [Teredinibacter sp. KSP-S5-2]|uniref:23S rRNA pseudouridine(1911/1915/1917) synthase RluD n=1 Tax=Teredinibacter sp. KSP-S5-2 TaxID=3034506 RepID=UPI0029344E52|nr:23S rRNA pseudouridine(1911/1915/1917) synthase RluD [Teredinibacter sp. KSP-S5-2]WNO09871.1 23S rRNA pseudouridine(1911/1915/1917) synthase RluD [Teredinibacter sp. KSP-S5-2]
MKQQKHHQGRVAESDAGSRLDQVAAKMFPDYSRARIQNWIKSGALLVDGRVVKPNTKLAGGESIILEASLQQEGDWEAEAMELDVVYEDESILVLNKPAGLVVHPGSGNWEGTLLNGLLHYCPSISAVPRAGIVHRLDKETSGLMVVAKTIEAQTSLVSQLQDRSVSREYEAIVWGETDSRGLVDGDIGRHPSTRTKMAVVDRNGKPARTHYQRLASIGPVSHLRLKLETGRTHQIRVHMSHIGYPLVGDPVYGRKLSRAQIHSSPIFEVLDGFSRQALHAIKLGLIHPRTKKYQCWEVPLAADISELISQINGL